MDAIPAAVITLRARGELDAGGGVWLGFVAGFDVGKDMVFLH